MSKSNLSHTEAKFHRIELKQNLKEKCKEAVSAVVPIMVIVLLLCFSIAPMSPSIMLEYIIGAVMLVIGMMFFTLGAEMAMTPWGAGRQQYDQIKKALDHGGSGILFWALLLRYPNRIFRFWQSRYHRCRTWSLS